MGRYWDKRSVELENLEQEKTDTDIMKVNKLFDGAIVYLQKEIGEIFDKYSKDSGLPGTAAQEMLNVKQTEEVRQALMNALAQCEDEVAKRVILGRLNAPAYAARIARLEALRDLVYAQAYKVGSAVSVTLKDRLIDTVEDSYYRTIYDMQKNTTYAYDFNKLADNDVKAAIAQNWAGGNYSSRIWKNTEKLAKNLENVIVQGLMTGQSIRTMSKRLEEAAEGDKYSINRLVRTEVNYCCNQGALMSFKDAEIEKYVFLATLDLRTSKICQSLDKKIFYVKDAKAGENYPPMHPHCRSTATAYIEGKDTSRLKRRARDPETGKTMLVPYDMNYAEWYNKYVLEREEPDISGEEYPKKDMRLLPKEKEFADVTEKWKKGNVGAQDIKDLTEYTVNGTTYIVDGRNVKLDYSSKEKSVAELLLKEFGGEISMVPRVLNPQGVSTPDYIFKNEGFDLKELIGKSKNVVYNAISKKKKQASNFVLDITNSPLDDNEILRQIEKVYWSDHTEFVDKIVVVKGDTAMKVYERKYKEK